MQLSGRTIYRMPSSKASSFNSRFFQRRTISTKTFLDHKEDLYSKIPYAKEQGPVDCHFATNNFLLADKPRYDEKKLWRRISHGNNGSTHYSERKSRSCNSASELMELWKTYGQVKIHARNITISKQESLNGKGTRFAQDSFHCINVVKIFDIGGKAYLLSYDPEANCGEADIEKLECTNKIKDEMSEFTLEELDKIQNACSMFRVDSAEMLLQSADFTHPESGLYVASQKPWIIE